VHHDDATRTVAVRVRVLFGRSSVRRPARVADAVSTVERLEANRLFEITQLAFGATDSQLLIFVNDGDPGGVVTAVLELAQPVENDWDYLLVANITNNATHKKFLLFLKFEMFWTSLLEPTRGDSVKDVQASGDSNFPSGRM
jgi:hypothetical protein